MDFLTFIAIAGMFAILPKWILDTVIPKVQLPVPMQALVVVVSLPLAVMDDLVVISGWQVRGWFDRKRGHAGA